jgi:hypothetical protein
MCGERMRAHKFVRIRSDNKKTRNATCAIEVSPVSCAVSNQKTPHDQRATMESMGSLSNALVDFLGSKGATVLAHIPESEDRAKIVEAMILCAASLNDVDEISLSDFELADSIAPVDRIWHEVQGPLETVEASINMTANALLELFGIPPPDWEKERGDESVELVGVIEEAESLVQSASIDRRENVGRDITALCCMLKVDLGSTLRRLRTSGMHMDSWTFLTEVADAKAMCVQSIEAMAAAVLKSHTSNRLSVVLPRYVSATMRAVRVRSLLTEVEAELQATNESLRDAPDRMLEAFALEAQRRIDRFIDEPAYAYMRPVDHRGVIAFRTFLREWIGSHGGASVLRREVEGFSKLLSVTRSMNDGTELVRHDREALQVAATLLDGGAEWMDALPYMESTYGRSPALDKAVRACRVSDPPVKALLRALMQDALEGLAPL